MKYQLIIILLSFCIFGCGEPDIGNNYYFDSYSGSDSNNGDSSETPLKSLKALHKIRLKPGDSVLLANGSLFSSPLKLISQHGSKDKPIVVTNYGGKNAKPKIETKGEPNAVLIENSSFVEVSGLDISANGLNKISVSDIKAMRCGVLVNTSDSGVYQNIHLRDLTIHDVFYNAPGYSRPEKEVRTPNGTENYGWGIRVISIFPEAYLKHIVIDRVAVENVSHTGIKFTGKQFANGHSIDQVILSNSTVKRSGGPGIQMSEISNGHIFNNQVDHSGNTDDSRKWGRGSGLWTWGSDKVLIEKNRFTNANGPGDSAGAHIDFNCSNVVLQYNFSANNAGGFCEILGNNYNCAYRYNISVNDGFRIKGEQGAFQEGKILWLSGYAGKQSRKGPFNSYFYNNTIFVKNEITAKVAIDRQAKGILIANNIFHIEGKTEIVSGDQYNPEKAGEWQVDKVFFSNNLFLKTDNWPDRMKISDANPVFGNSLLLNKGSDSAIDYLPEASALIRDRGVKILPLQEDSIGIIYGLQMKYDILGNKIKGIPDIGAIELE